MVSVDDEEKFTVSIANEDTVKAIESSLSLNIKVMGVLSIKTINESIGTEIESILGGNISFNSNCPVNVRPEKGIPASS